MIKNLFFFMVLLLTGNTFSQSYKISDHYDGNKFFDPHGVELKSLWALIKWQMTSDRVEWPEHVPNKNYLLRPLGVTEKYNVTFINHASFLLQLPGTNVLTDPVFSERVSPSRFLGPKRVRDPGMAFEELPKIDVVLVSHNHYDHLDLETIKNLDQKFHPLFIVPLGDERLLKEAGILHVQALDWWEEVRVKDVRFIFSPSQHWSARHLWDKNESLWGSFMIDNGSSKIYFAGDTGHGRHFIDIKSRLGAPDLALLPIGAYKPRWFMKDHHMDPEESVQAHIDLGAERSMAMHFGTFQLTDEGIDEPVRDLEISLQKKNISTDRFMVLDQGQAFSSIIE